MGPERVATAGGGRGAAFPFHEPCGQYGVVLLHFPLPPPRIRSMHFLSMRSKGCLIVVSAGYMLAAGYTSVFLQVGFHSMGTIFQQHRRLVSNRNCAVGTHRPFLPGYLVMRACSLR